MKHLSSIIIGLVLWTSVAVAQTGEIPPSGNLIVEGIPKIPVSLAEAVGRYSEFRSATLSSWHPARREMLIATRFGETRQVHQVTSPGGARRQLTFFKDSVTNASYQPTHGNYFVFSKDVRGDEFHQLYRYDLGSGAITLLTDGKSRNTGVKWANAGDRIAYGSTRRNGTDVDIYAVDPTRPESDRLLAELQGGGWSVLDWSPDDRTLLVSEYVSINEGYLWLIEVAAGKKTLLTPKRGAEKIAYKSGLFSKDGKGVYVTTDRDSEFLKLSYIDLTAKSHTTLTPQINWDVEEFDITQDGKTLAFVTNEAGISVLHILEISARKERTVSTLPTGTIWGIRWHKNGSDLGITFESARSPMDAYSLDAATGKVERWTSSETGGLNTEHFVEQELIRWTSFDGREITGFLYRPPIAFVGKRPVVVDIHGGPEWQARPGFLESYNYYLNELGVALIFPNVRGSSGYGKAFLKLDNGFLREDTYKDVAALFDWIKTRPDLDGERIMVRGISYGGHMTLAVATFYSDRIRCALDVVGISNLVTFLENTQSYRRDLRRVEYGDERDPQMRSFLERIAPMNNLQMVKKPLFVAAGKNDPRVPASESEQIVGAVRTSGTPVWFLMAKDEGHGFAKKSNRDYLFYATVLFVKEYLLN